MYKISVDREKCIGCGACTNTCDNFELKNGKSNPKQTEVQEIGCNKAAENVCPVKAISIE
jgi:ferredoxin